MGDRGAKNGQSGSEMHAAAVAPTNSVTPSTDYKIFNNTNFTLLKQNLCRVLNSV
jgi:hypothetical protein